MAVERVREGEAPSAVIASYGFCRTTIYKWLNKVKGRGRGLRALRARKGTGRDPPRQLRLQLASPRPGRVSFVRACSASATDGSVRPFGRGISP